MKKRVWMPGLLLLFLVGILCFPVRTYSMETVSMNPEIVINCIDGKTISPREFTEDMVVLFYGRTSCPNTRRMIAKAESLREQGYSVKSVLMAVDEEDTGLESFGQMYQNVTVAHKAGGYNSQMWSMLNQAGIYTTSVTLPVSLVMDKSRTVVYIARGYETEDLERVIKKQPPQNIGQTPSEEEPSKEEPPAVQTYTITYRLHGGKQNKANPSSYVTGQTIVLKNPTKKGYLFNGWKVAEYGNSYMAAIYPIYAQNFVLDAEWTKVKPKKLAAPVLKNLKTRKLKVSWKVSGKKADRYQIYLARNSRFTKGLKKYTVKNPYKTISNLKKGQTYYVKVRAGNKDSLKKLCWGSFSKAVKIKIRK